MDVQKFLTSPRYDLEYAFEHMNEIATVIETGLVPRIEVDDISLGIDQDTPLIHVDALREKAAALVSRFPVLVDVSNGIMFCNGWMVQAWLVEKAGWSYLRNKDGYNLLPPAAAGELSEEAKIDLACATVKSILGVEVAG